MSTKNTTEISGAVALEQAQNEDYNLRLAAALYRWRSLQDRHVHPAGTFDSAGRWYPDADERCPECDRIRSPSRAYPYSYMVHCRSYTHVAAKYNVSVADLRREARACSISQKITAQESASA
jgi:hypothetical protein